MSMQRVDLSKPAERKKLIGAIVLGIVAIVFLWWAFFGFGSAKPNSARITPSASPPPTQRQRVDRQGSQTVSELRVDVLSLQPVSYERLTPPVAEAKRNIFSYYEPPLKPQAEAQIPTPTPTPTPPVLLAAILPNTVYARTGDFTLELTGNKFDGALRVTIDGREMPTRFIGPQQISASIPASAIATPGPRQVSLRSPDGKSYSNGISLNVSQPPTPNYNYVGIIRTTKYIDTAILQDRNNREIMNVQRGDVLGGRFRITSISEKELVLVDTNLKIRHTLAFTTEAGSSFNPLQRPTPKVDSEDDEP